MLQIHPTKLFPDICLIWRFSSSCCSFVSLHLWPRGGYLMAFQLWQFVLTSIRGLLGLRERFYDSMPSIQLLGVFAQDQNNASTFAQENTLSSTFLAWFLILIFFFLLSQKKLHTWNVISQIFHLLFSIETNTSQKKNKLQPTKILKTMCSLNITQKNKIK